MEIQKQTHEEKASHYRAELLDALNNFQEAVNNYIASGINELGSWRPKMDDRFNAVRSSLRSLDAYWDSVREINEEA